MFIAFLGKALTYSRHWNGNKLYVSPIQHSKRMFYSFDSREKKTASQLNLKKKETSKTFCPLWPNLLKSPETSVSHWALVQIHDGEQHYELLWTCLMYYCLRLGVWGIFRVLSSCGMQSFILLIHVLHIQKYTGSWLFFDIGVYVLWRGQISFVFSVIRETPSIHISLYDKRSDFNYIPFLINHVRLPMAFWSHIWYMQGLAPLINVIF